MGDFISATGDMDDFLINPTVKAHGHVDELESRTSTLSRQHVVSMKRSLDLLSSGHDKIMAAEKRSFSIRTSLDDPLSEQLYWRGYCSDEEAASASATTDSDAMSVSSASSGEIVEAVPARLSTIMPEELAQSFRNIDRQLLRARAIVLRPIGGANSPISPKIIDIPPSPRLQRNSPRSAFCPPVSRLQRPVSVTFRSKDVSESSTPRTSTSERTADSAPTTPATSNDEYSPTSKPTLRHQPTMDSLRTSNADAFDYPLTCQSRPNESFIDFLRGNDPYPLGTQIRDHVTSIVPSRRRLKKLGSSLNFSRRNDSVDVELNRDGIAQISTVRPKPQVYVPSTRTSSSSSRPRMIARGASERLPVLVIPPVPKSYKGDRAMPTPKSYAPTGAPKRLHRRRTSGDEEVFDGC